MLDVVLYSWWYAAVTLDTMALHTPQRLAVLVTGAVVTRHAPIICPPLNTDMSPIRVVWITVAVLLLC